GAYERFRSFGGPSVYFHEQCLQAGANEFLSERHLEMLYATLASWGMHRMGDPDATKTRLTDWPCFHDSILQQVDHLKGFRNLRMLDLSERDYCECITGLKPHYEKLKLSVSRATVVVNAKALYHIFPELIPPVDRQYTIRFFKQAPECWRNARGKFRMFDLPVSPEEQFNLFHEICVRLQRLGRAVDPAILTGECVAHDVTVPKALDNAIVNYVKIVAGPRPKADTEADKGRE
ncbi:MAG TPA: hypothetical protein VFA39_19890, partial [Steroidobacteraceae bacterium]|nr:hypothetical protein [Steroidobacteraceae bacterium]